MGTDADEDAGAREDVEGEVVEKEEEETEAGEAAAAVEEEGCQGSTRCATV